MRVLLEQEVTTRRLGRKRSRSRGGRSRSVLDAQRLRRDGARFRVPAALGTMLLACVVVGLAVTLVVVLPDLESVSDGEPVLAATAPDLPSLRHGLVEVERTEQVEHVVEQGETLSEIAARYDVDLDALVSLNSLRDPHTIRDGHPIIIPARELR